MSRWNFGLILVVFAIIGAIGLGGNFSPDVRNLLSRSLINGAPPRPWASAEFPTLAEHIGRALPGSRVLPPWKCLPEQCGFWGVQFVVELKSDRPHSVELVNRISKATVNALIAADPKIAYPNIKTHRVTTQYGAGYVVLAADLKESVVAAKLRELVDGWRRRQYGPPQEPELRLGSSWEKFPMPELEQMSRDMATMQFAGAWICPTQKCKTGGRIIALRFIPQPDGFVRTDSSEVRQLNSYADRFSRTETDEIYRSNSVFTDYQEGTNAPRFIYRVSSTHADPRSSAWLLAQTVPAYQRANPLGWAQMNQRLAVE